MIVLLTAIAIILAVLAVVLFYVVIDCVTIAVNWVRAWPASRRGPAVSPLPERQFSDE